MQRKKLIAGNWKLNMNKAETQAFLEEFNQINKSNNTEAMIIPPFTSLETAKENRKTNQLKLGAQNLSQYKSGAYTGEISAEMLIESGVEAVLIGHSERREIFLENNSIINAKITRAFEAGLTVIFCCGESETIRNEGRTDEWVAQQLRSALENNIANNLSEKFIIAYEPIWAIGTGKTCDSQEANRVIKFLRQELNSLIGNNAENVRILYGGSVKASTASELAAQSDIDGALVGGASLKASDFNAIIEGFQLICK